MQQTAGTCLAQEHRQAGDPRRALVVLDNALMALRESPATLVLLGDTYTDLARFEEAARTYRQALTINGEIASAWSRLAHALIRLARYAEAEEVAVKVEKALPKLAASIREGIVAARGAVVVSSVVQILLRAEARSAMHQKARHVKWWGSSLAPVASKSLIAGACTHRYWPRAPVTTQGPYGAVNL